MTTQTSKKLGSIYFENLDALRFLAAISVFFFHYFRDLNTFFPELQDNFWFDKMRDVANKGTLGVNFFFVLSGFLITYLILTEKKTTGKFSLWKFLVRRTLRIWPLYFIIVILGFGIFPLVFDWYYTDHHAINYLFFLANFDEIWYGVNDPINFLTAPWSVAVEEQFYLFWGIAMYFVLKLKKFPLEILILVIYLLSFYYRWLFAEDARTIYYHTFAVCQDILTGTFLGLSLFRAKQWIKRIQNLKKIWVFVLYAFGIGLCLFKNKIFIGEYIVFERFVLSLFFAYIIIDQIGGKHSFIKMGKIKPFNYLGKISYGLYMYHLVIMFLVTYWFDSSHPSGYYLIPLYFAASLAGTIIVSALSYHFMERKFLNLKPK